MLAILSPQRARAARRLPINLGQCVMVHQPGPRSAAEAVALAREAEAVSGPRKRKVRTVVGIDNDTDSTDDSHLDNTQNNWKNIYC